MKCPKCNLCLEELRRWDEIIDDCAIVHMVYFCDNCKHKVYTESVGEIRFWYPEEIKRTEK